jgi:hypothetical protein
MKLWKNRVSNFSDLTLPVNHTAYYFTLRSEARRCARQFERRKGDRERGGGVQSSTGLIQIINPHSPKWHWKCCLLATLLAQIWYPSQYMWRWIPPRRICDVIFFPWLFLPCNSSWESSSVTIGQPSTRISATWWLSSLSPFVTQKQCLKTRCFYLGVSGSFPHS